MSQELLLLLAEGRPGTLNFVENAGFEPASRGN
jgi:hypothetical protein